MNRRGKQLLFKLLLTFLVFVGQAAVSRLSGSMALLGSSFHILADAMAMATSVLNSLVASMRHSSVRSRNTFGWARAEVMGKLVNAVFITTLCFIITLEALNRFMKPSPLGRPLALLLAGSMGLIMTLICLLMYWSDSQSSKMERSLRSARRDTAKMDKQDRAHGLQDSLISHAQASDEQPTKQACPGDTVHQVKTKPAVVKPRGISPWVRNVLGSLSVVFTSLLFNAFCGEESICYKNCVSAVEHCHLVHRHPVTAEVTKPRSGVCWPLYVDPTLCLINVFILIHSIFPAMQEATLILLQTVPRHVDLTKLETDLYNISGVLGIHELHVWQLVGNRSVATLHVKCICSESYLDMIRKIRACFQSVGIHAVTVQPEFVSQEIQLFNVDSNTGESLSCELPCSKQCTSKQCCTGPKLSPMTSKCDTSGLDPWDLLTSEATCSSRSFLDADFILGLRETTL
ncbi:zinc transporter 1-like [Erpetoichthys calabaricus]|uniref:zinc transporter 1-like n=1 Tax=Erpetoichthys calabaricus TaxID=27687 RepID=UPI002234B932|nr:zinc transporter 1-like [Erpetoichthys calabaricus]